MEVLGVERRRRWTDAAKLEILSEVNTNGWRECPEFRVRGGG